MFMFSDNLKKARKKSGISQEELAASVNVTRQAVTKWENGENEPSLQTISLITKVLQVEAAYLIDGEESAERVTAPQKKAVHSFTWGSFLKTSALFFAFAAFLLLLLPGVSGLANVMAYCLIFGLEGSLPNPIALAGWIILLTGFLSFCAFFFVSPNKLLKKVLFWLSVGLFLAAGILFLSCQAPNPRSLAGSSEGLWNEGLEGVGPSFKAEDLNKMTLIVLGKNGFGNVTPYTSEYYLLQNEFLLSRYTLIGDTYYYTNSSAYYLARYTRETTLGPGFISAGVLCLASAIVAGLGYFVKDRKIEITSTITPDKMAKSKSAKVFWLRLFLWVDENASERSSALKRKLDRAFERYIVKKNFTCYNSGQRDKKISI
jgi:transcriptional regulator with XRE-family HTH domain